ncbi:hypothetical protein DID88_006690 [Monilinia fructigena]|uniref:Uncharacterized protein n=1 Tax=Monilinia fructigena TaxID=38457 RepID=A0A395IGT5_9HELO|nr:hypothetical protein DID88_006690 [Monilinia fructigena]
MWDTDYGPRANQVDANTQTSAYPHPDLSLPHPSLNLDFRMSVSLNPKIFSWTNTVWTSELDIVYWRNLVRFLGIWNSFTRRTR